MSNEPDLYDMDVMIAETRRADARAKPGAIKWGTSDDPMIILVIVIALALALIIAGAGVSAWMTW